MANSKAIENRRIRQDAIREQIQAKNSFKQIIDNIEEIEKIDVQPKEGEEVDYKAYQAATLRVQTLKNATEMRLKLLNKYLPDEKSLEITGDLETTLTVVRKEYKPSK